MCQNDIILGRSIFCEARWYEFCYIADFPFLFSPKFLLMMSCMPVVCTSVSSPIPSSVDLVAAYQHAKTAVYHMMSSKGRLTDYNAAEEILSDTIDKIISSAHLYNPEKGKLFTWVYTIALHCRNDYFEKQTRLHSKEVGFDDISFGEKNQLGGIYADETFFEMEEVVDSAIDCLIPRDKEIIRYSMKGYKSDEIGTKLSMTDGHVRNRLSHIRARLHRILDKAA